MRKEAEKTAHRHTAARIHNIQPITIIIMCWISLLFSWVFHASFVFFVCVHFIIFHAFISYLLNARSHFDCVSRTLFVIIHVLFSSCFDCSQIMMRCLLGCSLLENKKHLSSKKQMERAKMTEHIELSTDTSRRMQYQANWIQKYENE